MENAVDTLHYETVLPILKFWEGFRLKRNFKSLGWLEALT